MDYLEKLKDPRWQKKRLEIFKRDEWRCKCCGSKDRTLHVHHLCYSKGKDPWEIDEGFLITVCEECHKDDSVKAEFFEALGVLLMSIWHSKYDFTDVYTISEAILKVERPKGTPADWGIEMVTIDAKNKISQT